MLISQDEREVCKVEQESPEAPHSHYILPQLLAVLVNSKCSCSLLAKEENCLRQWKASYGSDLFLAFLILTHLSTLHLANLLSLAPFSQSCQQAHLVRHHIRPCTGKEQANNLPFSKSTTTYKEAFLSRQSQTLPTAPTASSG